MIVCVEGNVGAGKTDLLARLESFGYRVVRQPAALWRRLLVEFDDAAFVQCAVLAWYLLVARRLRQLDQHTVVFVERSPLSAHAVFTANCVFDPATEAHYRRLKALADRDFCVSAYFYVSTPPTECYNTLVARRRVTDRTLLHLYNERYWQMATQLVADGVWVVAG